MHVDEALEEIEALKMMFPEAIETNFDAKSSAESERSFTLKLEDLGLALAFSLPRGYPVSCAPRVVATSSGGGGTVSRQELSAVNKALGCVLEGYEPWEGLPVLYDIISWVQENATKVLKEAKTVPKSKHQEIKRPSHSNGKDTKISREWIWFIGFYTKKIIKAFISTARDYGLTGFLMPGKPGVACLEGPKMSIDEFLRVTRTQLFATVAPSSRKMKLVHREAVISNRAFKSFEEVQMSCLSGSHKRKDLTNLGDFQKFLTNAGCGHAFKLIFNDAL
ncbi:hypothetical protein AAMO2058_001388200 [Amorphochlora amoebiformis]